MKHRSLQLIPIVVFALLVLGLHWQNFSHLAFWDEPKVYLRPLFQLYEHFWDYLSTPPTLYDRPLGLHFFYLPWLHLFGPHLVVIRVLNYAIVCAGAALFYLALSPQHAWAVLGSLALLLVTPVTQAYFLEYTCEYQLFFCFSLTLYLLERHPTRVKSIFVTGLMAGLLRESSLALIPAIFCHQLTTRRYSWKCCLLLMSAPVWALALHWSRNLWLTGEVFHHLTIHQGHLHWLPNLGARWEQFYRTFLLSFRLLPLLLLMVGSAYWWRGRWRWRAADSFSLALVLCFLGVFTGHVIGIPRYYLPCAAFVYYLLLRPWEAFNLSLGRQLILGIAVVGSTCLMGDPTLQTNPHWMTYSGLQDGTQRPQILQQHARVMAAAKLHLREGDTVLTSWPFVEMLKSPYMGHGPVGSWRLSSRVQAQLPQVIIWTNFPAQIAEATVAQVLQQAAYAMQDFSYGPHVVKLYWRLER